MSSACNEVERPRCSTKMNSWRPTFENTSLSSRYPTSNRVKAHHLSEIEIEDIGHNP
jgi:hypothetical protein